MSKQEQLDAIEIERAKLKLEQEREAFNQKRAREQAKDDAARAKLNQNTFLGGLKTISSAISIGQKTASSLFPASKVTGTPSLGKSTDRIALPTKDKSQAGLTKMSPFPASSQNKGTKLPIPRFVPPRPPRR